MPMHLNKQTLNYSKLSFTYSQRCSSSEGQHPRNMLPNDALTGAENLSFRSMAVHLNRCTRLQLPKNFEIAFSVDENVAQPRKACLISSIAWCIACTPYRRPAKKKCYTTTTHQLYSWNKNKSVWILSVCFSYFAPLFLWTWLEDLTCKKGIPASYRQLLSTDATNKNIANKHKQDTWSLSLNGSARGHSRCAMSASKICSWTDICTRSRAWPLDWRETSCRDCSWCEDKHVGAVKILDSVPMSNVKEYDRSNVVSTSIVSADNARLSWKTLFSVADALSPSSCKGKIRLRMQAPKFRKFVSSVTGVNET